MAAAPVQTQNAQTTTGSQYVSLRVQAMRNAADAIDVLLNIFLKLKASHHDAKAVLNEGKEILKLFKQNIDNPHRCIQIANEKITVLAEQILGNAQESQAAANELLEWMSVVRRYPVGNKSYDAKDQKEAHPKPKHFNPHAMIPLQQSTAIVKNADQLVRKIDAGTAYILEFVEQLKQENQKKDQAFQAMAQEHLNKQAQDYQDFKGLQLKKEEALKRQLDLSIERISLVEQQASLEKQLRQQNDARIRNLQQDYDNARSEVERLKDEKNSCIIA